MSSNNKKIGYTTGVFDLFHVGHLEILGKAKENCDYLIVGVSTDELVQEYKNKRPIITFEQRIEIIKSIKYVDEVVVQKDRDKLSALHKIGFNIMFVGDDWKGSKIFLDLEREFQKYGVEIFYFPYTKNISSTSLRSILRRLIQEEAKDSN